MSRFPAMRLEVDSYNVKCNPQTDISLCKETLLLLDYIIEFHNRFPAKKIIFIHGHDTSWHYRRSVTSLINSAVKTEKFKKNDYGGLYRTGWHHQSFFLRKDKDGPEYFKMYNEIYANTSVFKYLNGYKISYPCCSTFYIDSKLINDNPLSLYKTVRDRIARWVEKNTVDSKHLPMRLFHGVFVECIV